MDLRVGNVGIGRGAHVQVPGFRAADGFDPVALCARTPERLAKVSARVGIEEPRQAGASSYAVTTSM